jgi:hypothetical protein
LSYKYYVYPYKQGSGSAKRLAEALNGRVLKMEGSSFQGVTSTRKAINWGSTQCPWVHALNKAEIVECFGNKLQAFLRWTNDPVHTDLPRIPEYTTSRGEAAGWKQAGLKVVCRGTLTGHSGAGITIVEGHAELPHVPLYVKYIPKDSEYRVHIFNNEVIDVQRKVRDPNREVSDWKVRSHQNGFIYVRSGSNGLYKDTAPSDVLEQAKKALASSGLTFGAVDVIWNNARNCAYVLEVNTAPGLEGQTVGVYADAIRRYYA